MEEPHSKWTIEKLDLSRASVWIVIPAFNEDEVIRGVVQSILAEGLSVVVVDDGSTEPAEKLLRGLPVHVCRHIVNLGQGAAIQTGFRYALGQGARYIVTFDADGQHRVEDIPSILEPLRRGRCQVTLGSRFLEGAGAVGIPPLRRLMLRTGTWMTASYFRMPVSDVTNGLRGFTAAAAAKIRITQNRMAHANQILQQVSRLGLAHEEVAVTVLYTRYSLAKGQRLSNLLNVIWESAMELIRR